MRRFFDKLDSLAGIGIVISLLLFVYACVASKITGVRIDLVFLLAEIVMAISICFIVCCFISTVVEIVKDAINSKNNKEKKDEEES